jgi:hypothetical protein
MKFMVEIDDTKIGGTSPESVRRVLEDRIQRLYGHENAVVTTVGPQEGLMRVKWEGKY